MLLIGILLLQNVFAFDKLNIKLNMNILYETNQYVEGLLNLTDLDSNKFGYVEYDYYCLDIFIRACKFLNFDDIHAVGFSCPFKSPKKSLMFIKHKNQICDKDKSIIERM